MKILKNKIFRILLWVTTISSFGDSLYALAVTLSVYQMSGSIAGVAGMWMIRVLVRIPCQFVSGVIIDRFNRKKISIYVYLLSAALMLTFALTDGKYMMLAYILIFILQGTSDVDNMAQMALMPELIDKEELTDANNIFSVMGTIIMFVGPGVGGVLYTIFGTGILYLIDAVTFIFAAGLMCAVPYRYEEHEIEKAQFKLFAFDKEGIAEVKKMPIIKNIMMITVFFGILGRFYEIDKIFVADKVLNIGAEGIVYFTYAMAIGSLLAPIATKLFARLGWRDTTKYSFLSILLAVSFMLWGNASVFLLSIVANIMIGFFQTSNSIMVSTIFQSTIERGVFGRVMAFRQIVTVLGAAVGIIMAPVLVQYIGVGGSMFFIGILAATFSMVLVIKIKIQKSELTVRL